MKLSIRPTTKVGGTKAAPLRIWEGHDERGVFVRAWISGVEPETEDAAIREVYGRELLPVDGEEGKFH